MEEEERPKFPRIAFHKALFFSSITIFSLFILSTFFYQYSREKAFRQQQLNDVLQTYNYTILKSLENNSISIDSIGYLADYLSPNALRLTLMDLKGNVIADNTTDSVGFFNNHFHRPEVQNAITSGEGYALRYSQSLGDSFFYAAKKSNNYILRTALPFNISTLTYLKIDKGIITFFIFISITFMVVIFYFSKRLGKSISTLREFSHKAENNEEIDINIKLPNNDIGAITKHIIKLYSKIKSTKQQVATEKDKLIKHLQISKEGLAVFDANKKPIFANSLFIQYINIISDNEIGEPLQVIYIPEFSRIKYFLDLNQKEKSINNSEYMSDNIFITKNGKTFAVECIIFQDKSFEISINNVTQAEEETRIKRQLTQNIAHELKTPVSSIKGYLETITTNTNIDPKTKDAFINKCYAQTNRLTGLLQDISTLNRIDEAGSNFEMEELNLNEMIEDILIESETTLKEKEMTTSISIPENCIINGNHSLIYSIFRNLFDNSMDYAGTGKTITIK